MLPALTLGVLTMCAAAAQPPPTIPQFTDATASAGIRFRHTTGAFGKKYLLETLGSGVAFLDVDNDGGQFEDVTDRAGVGDPGFSTSALWFDYDRDGRLDLFVGNYVEWSSDKDQFCTLNGKAKSYCTPESYKGQSPTLYRNLSDGTFENVTRKAGLYDPTAKTLGLALIDYDNDGLIDVFAANDTQPNRLYRNKGDGTFAD